MRKLRSWSALKDMLGKILLVIFLLITGVFVFLPLGTTNFDVMSWIAGSDFVAFVLSAVTIFIVYALLSGKRRFDPSGGTPQPKTRTYSSGNAQTNHQRPNPFNQPRNSNYRFGPPNHDYGRPPIVNQQRSQPTEDVVLHTCELCGKQRPEKEMALVDSKKGAFFICENHVKQGRYSINATE